MTAATQDARDAKAKLTEEWQTKQAVTDGR